MREIKFRAWENPDSNVSFLWSMHHWYDVLFYLHKWVNNQDYEIMQFTWLLDKNWVEIWEWDIVQVNMKTDKDTVWCKRQAEIVWESPLFVLDYSRWLPWDLHIWRCPIEGKKDLEVIGNIYENPD